ncbi:MAG: DUF2291 domain-containing protein [Ilumatobacteraceae bacterium]|nr:DUF2291 domain-containing protein [Ilumatobacteraceae bacterium]
MKHQGRWIAGIAAVAFVAALPSALVIVDEGELSAQQQSEAFDPVVYVDDIWESSLLPTIDDEAQELATVLDAIEVDAGGNGDKAQLVQVTEEYGTITVGEAHVYLVRGTGTVTEVSDRGFATIALDGYDGPTDVVIYAGTRIPSDETSVRDGVGSIDFGDFKTQTEYGQVASEINKRIVRDVLNPLADTDLTGRQISFMGALAIRTFNLVQIDLSSIRIVPVRIEMAG